MLSRRFLKEFENPSNEWRFAPFWFLNHRLEDEELIRQIHEMNDAGMGGFVLHARHGLLTPYLSKEWMDRIETCCAEAKSLGMWAWLYDENNWPSAQANGMVFAEHPEYRMSQLYISMQEAVTGPLNVSMELPDKDELGMVLLAPTDEEGKIRYDGKRRVRDLTRSLRGALLKTRIPAGNWTVLVLSRCYAGSRFFRHLTDTLNRDACKLFIRHTHEAYARRLRKYYGKTVKGIFTDEPSSCYASRSDSIHWTPQLPKAFAHDHKYPLTDALPALFFDVGPQTARYRCDFFATVLKLYAASYFGAIENHCKWNRILSIGHLCREGELRWTMKDQMDFFAVTDRMHYSGVDTLRSTIWPEDVANMVSVKLASSAAHLLEKPRVMNESWGLASGWKLDLEEMKLLGDWHVVLGSNYFMPHAFYYSIDGVRKWECAPDEFYHEPYWPYYRHMADRLARLSMVFTGGQHVAPVAVLYPVRTCWAAQPGLAKTDAQADQLGQQVQKTFFELSEELLRARLDFDYLSEEILQKAEFSGGRVVARGKGHKALEEFQVLILPEISVLDRDTARAIDDYVTDGGRLYVVGNRPAAYTETGTDPAIGTWLEDLANAHPERVTFFDKVTPELIAHIGDAVQRDLHIENNRDIVALQHRRKEGSVFFLLNTSRSSTFTDVSVSLAAAGTPSLMDPTTGRIHPLTNFRHDGERTVLTMDFAPRQSHLILLEPASGTSKLDTEPGDEKLRLRPSADERVLAELSGPWAFTAEKGNYLPLTEYSLRHGTTTRWNLDEWREATLTHQTRFEVRSKPTWCRLILDGLMRQECFDGWGIVPVKVRLNGVELKEFVPSDHYDRLCYEVDVLAALREGINTLEVSNGSGGMGPNAHLVQPVVLVGDFAVASTDHGDVMDAPKTTLAQGDWTREGFPYFSGIGSLKKEIELPEFVGRTFIRFERVAGCVEVLVHGKSAGVVLWPPYELELTGFLVPGINQIELRIANTNYNLFMREPLGSGLCDRTILVLSG